MRRRGAPPATIDDALQTAALRAWSRPGSFDSLDGMAKWVLVVAWNEVQAEWRRQARVDFGEVPERPGGPDPAVVVEGRIDLGVAIAGLACLSDADREAITATLVDETVGPPRPQVKMRRHRARQRLADLVADPSLGARRQSGWASPGSQARVTPRP